MEWWVILIIIIGLLLSLFLSALPVAFAFLFINLLGSVVWMAGASGLRLIVSTIPANIGSFTLVAVPLFIFMGEVLFRTGIAGLMVTALGKWIGGIRGSLALVATAAGTLFAMMSGSGMSGVAVLGSTLIPEMKSRGYSNQMSLGPVLGAGGLATIIPPSIAAVILATLANVSVGRLLIAGLLPGFVLAGLYATYILVRAHLQPHLAPLFVPPHISWGERFKSLAFISPMSLIIFLVLGLIFLGIATPSEAAATGVTGAFLLALAYRRLTWETIKKSVMETVIVSTMVFMIFMGSMTFSQILAYTGATSALVALAKGLPVHPIVVVIIMQLILIVLGCFIDTISIMMISVPIYFPVILALGLDPIWFGILMLVNIEMATISPPFGLHNFVMKGVVPDASMTDIILAGIPFFFMGLIVIGLMLVFPSLVTWLPRLMG